MCIVPRMIDVQKKWHCPHYWKSSQDNSGLTQTFDFHSLASVVWERKFRTRAVLEALVPRALTYYNGFPTQILISRYFSGRESERLTYFLGANIILELFLTDWVVLSFEINLLSCGEQSSQNVFLVFLKHDTIADWDEFVRHGKRLKRSSVYLRNKRRVRQHFFVVLRAHKSWDVEVMVYLMWSCGGMSLCHLHYWTVSHDVAHWRGRMVF